MLKMVTGQWKPPAEPSTHWTWFLTLSCSTKQECSKYQIIWQSSIAWKTTVCIAKYFPELEAHKDYCFLFSTQKYSTNMTLSAFCNMAPRRTKRPSPLWCSLLCHRLVGSMCPGPSWGQLIHYPYSCNQADCWSLQFKKRKRNGLVK